VIFEVREVCGPAQRGGVEWGVPARVTWRVGWDAGQWFRWGVRARVTWLGCGSGVRLGLLPALSSLGCLGGVGVGGELGEGVEVIDGVGGDDCA
jgi:hypothetical protein